MFRNPFALRITWTVLLAGLGLATLPASGRAGIVFDTGNHQYTNVNIDAETTAITVTGYVGQVSDNIPVLFNGFDASNTAISLHGQHGVAFVEPANSSDSLYKLTLTMANGYFMTAADWKLDAVPPNDGTVTFAAYDGSGNLIALSSGTDTFAISHNGQNPYNFMTDGGSLVKKLVITSTVPLADIKQVSIDAVPEPSSLALLGIGGIASAILVRRRASARRALAAN